MDIGDNGMEKIDLSNIKALATEICTKSFFEEQDCQQKAEEAILEASNYVNDDPVKHFATMAVLFLRYYGKTKDLYQTFILNDNASIFSLDIISRLSEFPYEDVLTPVSYYLCQQLNKDPRRCIDSLGYLSFWHYIHMYTLTYRHKGAPIDDEFTYLLYSLLRNITMQYIVTGDIKTAEKAQEIVTEYLKKTIQEFKDMKKDEKK